MTPFPGLDLGTYRTIVADRRIGGPGDASTSPALAEPDWRLDVPDRTCSVDTCPNRHYCRGWCAKHYMRWEIHGDVDTVLNIIGEPDRRFWRRVDKTAVGGCWIWTAGRDKDGYGKFRDADGRTVRAHRWLYEQTNGPIPEGLPLDHFVCDNPPCVNPAHLRPETTERNVLRNAGPSGINSRKTHCVRGHEFTPENTHVVTRTNGRTSRQCRACGREMATLARGKRRSSDS